MQQHGKSPRKRKLALFFTYGVMTTAVAVISAVCILLVLGYRFDLKSGDVEQGALLQLRSFPQGASITLDNETLSFVTPGKRNVDAGKHTVTMKLKGYRPWEKTINVKPSELRWLNYARLIPETVKTTAEKEFPTLSAALPSPDRKWMIVQPSAEKPELILIDIRDENTPVYSQLTLPAGSYSEKPGHPHQFSLVEWDFGSKYILLKHSTGDVTEYVRINRSDADDTVNISSKLGVTPQAIHFSGSSGSVFFALDNGAIRKLDSGAGTLSQPLVKDVASFQLFKTDTMAYVKQPLENRVGVGVIVNGKAVRVATYDATVPIYADINEYFNDHYLAIGRGTSVTIYKDPELSARKRVVTVNSASAINWLRLSSNGRFVVAGTGSQFVSYDLETSKKSDVNLPGTAPDLAKPLQWLDDYYLVSAADSDLRITEFDGANQQVITSALPGFPVTLNNDGRILYSFSKTQTGAYAFQSSLMTVKR